MIKSIDDDETEKIKPLLDSDLPNESNETTHISVLDSKGNAVSMTITQNGNYGSGVVSEKFGIALNNEMDDFTTQPGKANMYGLIQGKGNYVEPGKRPLSSMSPTLVEKNGKNEFIDFYKNNKIPVHKLVFEHYKKENSIAGR